MSNIAPAIYKIYACLMFYALHKCMKGKSLRLKIFCVGIHVALVVFPISYWDTTSILYNIVELEKYVGVAYGIFFPVYKILHAPYFWPKITLSVFVLNSLFILFTLAPLNFLTTKESLTIAIFLYSPVYVLLGLTANEYIDKKCRSNEN